MGQNTNDIQRELSRLREENARLKELLRMHGIAYETTPSPIVSAQKPMPQLSLEEKVALFRSLFRGREDVFARRWYSPKTEKSGYQPVCSKEWNPAYCNKKKYKCAECPSREFQPLGYTDVYAHLEGKDPNCKDVIGAYTILPDNTCFFLCCDFDDKSCDHGYQDDVRAYISVCRDWNIPAYVERSRSGNGAHVWILFSEPIKAQSARRLGNAILTEAMEREGRMSFKSYDRFFPNQDFIPEGGFGNMRKYVGLCNKLDAFRKKMRMHDITMEDLTVEFLTKFNNFLHKWKNEKNPEKLLHPNTIEVQLNIFKTLVNRAINLGYMSADKNPFLKFSYKGVPTMKEKLEMAEIQRIINLDLPEGSLIWNVRNYFLFSFYCAGIRAADFIQLRWRNVSSEGRLTYSMDKNGKFRDIVLVPQALEILKHYFRPDAKPDDYIFPLLDNSAPYAKFVTTADKRTITPDMRKTLYAAVSTKNALINKYLKKIAEKAEISKNVSFHISRHSFAKVAKETGLDSGIVKELLAHSNLATTERYMGNFDTQKTDNALINLFGGVEKPKDKKDEVIEALKGMSPEEIAAILSAIKK